jgi:hypothetical protein
MKQKIHVQGVAAQVDPFGEQALKPGFHFIGSRVETRRFQALWVNWIQLIQGPHQGDGAELRVLRAAA